MLTPVEKVLFVLLVLITVAAAYRTFADMFAIIGRGQGQLNWDAVPRRLWRGLLALFTQGRMYRRRPITAFFHTFVAWAFIYYLLVNVVDIAEALFAGFELLPGNPVGDIYRLIADILTAGALVGIVYLLLRRFAIQPRVLMFRDNVKLHPKVAPGLAQDSLLVGLFILVHVGSRFLASSFRVALETGDPWQPIASLFAATALDGVSTAALTTGWHIAWWGAVGTIFLFLPYFPYTKHAHLFMGPFNFMTRPERTALGALDPIGFEDESIEQFGVNKLTDLNQTHIVDAFACIMCNRCQEACPAYATGKELSPAALEINKRFYIKEHMSDLAHGGPDELPLLEYAISESAVWACTACGACVEVCPVGNEPMLDILDIRRDMVLMRSDFPSDLRSAFVGMERQSNPWNTTEPRMGWTKGLPFEVPTVEENPDYEYLLWVGCAGSFDPDAQETVRALATVMQAAGVSFAVLGDAESCTGDSARRAGNEYLFYEMALSNIETLNAAGADKKRIVTICPHCFTTIGKEYGAFGGHYQVFHHTQLIADLVGKGRLRLNGNHLEQTTFHDPCYLGRHNQIYQPPREALQKAGTKLLEMEHHTSNSFCCGAGGAQMWKEEEPGDQGVNVARFREATKTGATTLAVGCPFCGIMLRDANQKAGSPMQVQDVAQIVVQAMNNEQ